MKRRVLFQTVSLLSVGLATARGTTLVRLSLEQLSQASTLVVRGHVLRQESRWNPDHTRIVTLTTIAVEQAIKGAPPSTVVLEQLGGAVGNFHVYVPGNAHLAPQVSYVLFLEPAVPDSSRYLVVGMEQGAYRIYRDARTGEERVARPLGGFFYGPHEVGGGSEDSAETLALREFREQLSKALLTPLVIPPGTSIPVVIRSTEFRGVGRLRVMGETTASLYPSAKAVIPAGSPIEGVAQLVSGVWKINWNELSVRGTRVGIHAQSEEPRGETLRGRTLVLNVR